MLSMTAKRKAIIIAHDLEKDGMVWGDELEMFIKSQIYTKRGFKSDEDYLEFENIVLDYLEEKRKKKEFQIGCCV
ncbi:hypothetical protein QEW_4677 [Clostridioides difficile CD160]|nr:hypothetical protein QEW_4677 [Clostridioides difficile CD160]